MNILVVDDNREKYSAVFETFESDPINAFYFINPPEGQNEKYLADLMQIVRGESIEAIFSFSYYQFLSLACGVLNIPYLCWIVKGYEESSYDKTIMNAWNHVFCADYDTYNQLKQLGLVNLSFLPLSYKPSFCETKNPKRDILFITEDIQSLHSSINTFDLLKDSSKGYLDGVLNAKKSDLREKALFDNTAIYFREDMEENYPMPQDNLEPVGHKYDNRVFYPILDNKAQHIMLYHITADWVKEEYRVDVLSDRAISEKIENGRITYFTKDADGDHIDCNDYKITLYFPGYCERNMVTEKMLQIMESNTLMLLPGYVGNAVINECGALVFRNRYELSKLIKKYLFDDEVRSLEVRRFNEYTKEIGSYASKIKGILDTIRG